MRLLRRGILVVVALAALGAGGFALSLPSANARAASDPVLADLADLRPTKRARPLVAVLAHNDGSETTDFLVPYGVLARSGSADVIAVALRAGEVKLMPALSIRAQASLAEFDAAHPDGADYVFVPAMHRAQEPALGEWLRAQAKSGARVIGICDGAWVVAHAGLLDGRAATTHWFSAARLRSEFPQLRFTRDRRYVIDRNVATSTGVSASVPISLAVVEAIAGRARAAEVAAELGVARWDAGHRSADFELDRRSLGTALWNTLSVWSWETLELPLAEGADEVALALSADAWSRTYRTTVRATATGAREVRTRHGLVVIAEDSPRGAEEIALPPSGAHALDFALAGIGARYGARTAEFVALQLEYAR